MADPVTPPTPEELARAAAYENSLRNINSETRQHTGLVEENTQAQSRGSAAIDKSKEAVKALAQQFGLLGDSVGNFFSNSSGFVNLKDYINQNQDALKDLANTSARTFLVFTNLLPQNIKLFGQLHAEGTKAGVGIADSFDAIAPVLKKIAPDFLVEGLDRMVKAADMLQGQQFGLYRVAAASGQLNEFLKGTGDTLVSLGNVTAKYNDQLKQSAEANHTTISTVAEYSANLATIPGALGATINAGQRYGGTVSILTASIKVANAFLMDHKEVTDIMTQAYINFGTPADKALKIVSRIGMVAQDLGLPMDIVRRATMDAAESFKMFGDNTQAALNIIESFTPALRASGLGPAAIKEVVQGMTDGISKMDVAHKAFISGAAGGRGGLAGSFEIDEMMAKGEVDKVMAMVMNAMQRQFGGPALERKDVLSNPALAGEFQKQIEFIKSVGGLAGNDIQAQQVLAAMKSGSVADLEKAAADKGKKPEEAFAKSVEKGSNIQEKVRENTGRLVDLTRELQIQQVAGNIAAFQSVQLLAGMKRGSPEFDTAVQKAREAAERTASGGRAIGALGRSSGRIVTEESSMKDAGEHLKSVAKSIGAVSENFFKSQEMTKTVKDNPDLLKSSEFVKSAAGAFGLDAEGIESDKSKFSQLQQALSGKLGLTNDTANARTNGLPNPTDIMAPVPKTPTTQSAPGISSTTGPPEQFVKLEIDIKDGMEKVASKTTRIAIENFQARGTAVQPTE